MTTFAQLGIEFVSKGAAQAANDIQKVKEAATGADRAADELAATTKRLATDLISTRGDVKRITDQLDAHGRLVMQNAGDITTLVKAINDMRLSMSGAQTGTKKVTDELTNMGTASKKVTADLERMYKIGAQAGSAKGMRFAPIAREMDEAAKSARNLGPQIQNASFQVGDMAVQIAGGTDAVRALTMQLPQLLGGFGVLGAVAGGAAAVMGALIPALFNMEDGAKRLTKEIDALSDSVNEYKRFADMASMSSTEMAAKFGVMSGQMSKTSEFLAKIARVEAITQLDTAVQSLTETFGGLSNKLVYGTGGLFSQGREMREWERTAYNLGKELKLTDGQVRAVVGSLYLLGQADGVEQKIVAANDLSTAFERAFGSIEKVPQPLIEAAKQAGLIALEAGAIADANAAATATATELNAEYMRQIEMSRTILAYGADGAQVEALKRSQAEETVRAMMDQKGLTGSIADGIMASAMQAYDLNVQVSQAEAALRGAEAAARALAGAMAAAVGFSANLDNQIAILDAQLGAARNKQNVALAGQVKSMELQAAATRDAALAANQFGAASAVVAIAAESEYQAQLKKIGVIQEGTLALEAQNKANTDAAKGSKTATSAAQKAAKAAEKLTKQLDREAEKWKANLGPVEKYRSEMAKLEKVRSRLTGDEFSKAVKDLNVELADSLPLVGDLTDALVDGLFSGFKSGLKSILGVFKNWLAQMITTAAKNRIVMSMGLTGGGVLGAAGSAAAAPAMGGLGSGMLAGVGGIFSAFGAGASGFATALGTGGLGGALGYTKFMLSGATTGLTGFASAVGALALPLAGLAAVFSFFRSKTKLLDSGLRITASNMDALVETFKKTEKSRFWGLSKKRRTSYDVADAEVSDPIVSAISKAQQSIMDMADVLGFADSIFDDFTHQLVISTKDLDKNAILQAIADGVTEASDAFASMIPQLNRFSKEGEGATDTLTRLVTSLQTVNGAFDTLGYGLRYIGLVGADTASGLADLFGGLEAFSSATSSYWQVFYSEAERQEILTRQATAALEKYNTALPRSRDEYRALVDAQDLTTESGRKLWAALIQMSGTMDAILPSVSALTRELEKLQGNVSTALDSAIASIEAMVKINAQAATDWYAAAGKARDLIDSLRGTAGSVTTKQQALLYNQTKYLTTYAAALAGDLKAAQNITGIAQSYLTSVNATARTREDAALAQARVLSQMQVLGGAADIEGAKFDIMSGLYQQQVDLMTDARDFIAAGNALTRDMIDKLQGGLGSIDDAIDAASKISYANLRKQIELSLDVVQDAKIPQYLKNLLADTSKGIDAFVDFVVRSDLKPDMKWLALHKTSDHLKTVQFIADNKLGPGLAKVALGEIGRYQLSVETAVGKGPLNADTLTKLITGTKDGKITLGGSFVFDPAKGFSTLMQTSMETPLKTAQTAMQALKTALDKLREAIVTPAPVTPPAPPTNPSTGGGTGGSGGGATKPKAVTAADFVATSRFDSISGASDKWQGTTLTVKGPLGGMRTISVSPIDAVKLGIAGSIAGMSNASLINALFKGGMLPAFAAGGDHAGGLRIVGEHGPELEATGQSRIYNARQTQQMLGGANDELIAEVRALRLQMEKDAAFNRVQTGKIADSTRAAEKIWRKLDAVGIATREEP